VSTTGAWLVDERWLKAYPIHEALSIGRGAHNAVILRDHAVSRTHATVTSEGGGFRLRATGATGTLLNGVPVQDDVLEEGDVIEIASSHLRFTRQPPDDEMLVIPRDKPVSLDRIDSPTRTFPLGLRRRGRPSAGAFLRAAALLAFVLMLLAILLGIW